MSKIATFKTKKGTKTWQVSSSGIMDLDGFSTSFELNAESNNAVEGSPLSNQRGKKKKPLSFSSNLLAALGIDVRKEFESWEDWIGLTGTLKIGGKKFGSGWLLTAVKPSNVIIDNSGRFISMNLSFSFEENDDVSDSDTTASVNSARSAAGVTASTSQKSNKKSAVGPKAAALSAGTPVESVYAVGTIVLFKGGPQYMASTAAEAKRQAKAGPAKITAIAKTAKHPYHIVHTDKTSDVFGWVDASQFSKLTTQSDGGRAINRTQNVMEVK